VANKISKADSNKVEKMAKSVVSNASKKPAKEKSPKDKSSFGKDFKAELKRVTWPTPKQLVNNTTAVVVIVLITAAVVFILDVIFENLNKYGVEGLKSVVTALLSNPVYRLRVSWQLLPETYRVKFEELAKICSEDNNFAKLRTIMKVSIPPTIPYLGSTLTDLIYTNDGNRTSNENRYNFYKLRGIGNLIKEIQVKQRANFSFGVSEQLKNIIHSPTIISNEDQLYKMSQRHEAKVDGQIDLSKKPYKKMVKEVRD